MDSTNLFTCLACQIAFNNPEQQREHYQTDWHRYNLKRKVVQLPPVTAESFAQRLLAQQTKAEDDSKAIKGADCRVCNKVYTTKNAFDNHLKSKKHKEAELKMLQKMQNREVELAIDDMVSDKETSDFPVSEDESEISRPFSKKSSKQAEALNSDNLAQQSNPQLLEAQRAERDINRQLDSASTEEEIAALIEKKMKTARRLTAGDCLFCNIESADLNANMIHMQKTHSFYIPDVEYLVDLKGLIEYLGEKITVANVCLYCNGRGRGLRSLEAVRKHMEDKGHCKIAYDTEIDILEISDYYDFSSTYPENLEYNDIAMDVEEDAQKRSVHNPSLLEEDDGELVLPNGNRIGHRSLHYIYKQNLNVVYEKESVQINRQHLEYNTPDLSVARAKDGSDLDGDDNDRAKNLALQRISANGPRSRDVILALPGGKQVWKDIASYKEKRKFADFKTRIGIKANRLQKYFRHQNPV